MEATMEAPATTETSTWAEYHAYWKSISRNNQCLPAYIFLLHDLIREKDPKSNSFSPITNKNKLANGCNTWSGLCEARDSLNFLLTRGNGEVLLKMMKLGGTDAEKIKAELSLIKRNQ